MTRNPTTNTEAGAVADVAAIARGLMRASRQRALLERLCTNNADQRGILWAVLFHLRTKGLVAPSRITNLATGVTVYRDEPTPLGLAVRQHLEQGATAGVVEMNEQMFGQGDSPRQDEGTVV